MGILNNNNTSNLSKTKYIKCSRNADSWFFTLQRFFDDYIVLFFFCDEEAKIQEFLVVKSQSQNPSWFFLDF